ncbi:MAG: O-antigen ligase family protein [Planctomycetota bacterium]
MSAHWIAGAILLAWLVILPSVGLLSGWTALAHGLAVTGLVLLAARRLLRESVVRPGLPGLCSAAALLSLGVAYATAPERFPRLELQRGVATALLHAACFASVLVLAPRPEEGEAPARRVRNGLVVLLGALLLVQALTVWLGADSPDADHRPTGSLGNPNVLATVVAACGVALAGWLHFRPLVLLALAPLLLIIVATRSRGAVLALGLTLVVLAVRRRQRALLAALAVGLALLAVVPNPLRERVLNLQPDLDFSRPFLWGAALQSIAEQPLGIGPAMNKYVFPARAWNEASPWMLHQRHGIGLTHNVFLTLTLEWGWLAGAALLLLTAWAALRLWTRPTKARSVSASAAAAAEPDALKTGAALGAAVCFVELQVDGLEQNPLAFSLFLVLLGVALTRSGALSSSRPTPARGWSLSGRLAAGLLLAAALPALVFTAWSTRGAKLMGVAQEAQLASQAVEHGAPQLVAEARAAFDAAEAALPLEARTPWQRFLFEQELTRTWLAAESRPAAQHAADLALAAVRRARAANGADWVAPREEARFLLFLYRSLERRPEWLEGYFSAMSAVLANDPLDVDGHFDLAQESHRAGYAEQAEAALVQVFRLEPDYAYAWQVWASLLEFEGDLERSVAAWVRAEEAVLNCHVKAQRAHPKTRAFYEKNIVRSDLALIRRRLHELRLRLYF